MKPLYIGATLQDTGKTSFCLGLMQVLTAAHCDTGYCKPVGQHYVHYHRQNVDEDAVLVHKVFKPEVDAYLMSPIAIERGFTKRFIMNPEVEPLERKIVESCESLQKKHEILIVEGTGHAGVGSCFGLSNARVAKLIGARVIIVASGGIGKPLDEIALNLSLFRDHDVEVAGVILNKVLPAKYDIVKEYVSKGLEHLGTRLIGALPYDASLKHFTMSQLVEHFDYKVHSGRKFLTNRISNTVVAAMEPVHAIKYIRENTLVIVAGDRTASIVAVVNTLNKHGLNSGGIIITGGLTISAEVEDILMRSSVPVLVSESDTFTVSSGMKDLEFKIRSFDSDKILALGKMVGQHIDAETILSLLE